MIEADRVRAAASVLRSYRRVVLLAHVNPDADALGSALALGVALHRTGVEVQVSFGEPQTVPRSLRGLPGQDLVVPASAVTQAPLVVTVDVNTPHRLGALSRLLDGADQVLVIDHHASNTRFGTVDLVDPAAESTTVLVAALLDELGLPIDRDIAENLYAGLATDSVGFRHAGSAAHRLAARLIDAGVQPDDLLRPVTESHPPAYLAMLSRVLERAVVEPLPDEGTWVWTAVETADQAEVGSEETDSIIDILRTVAAIRMAAVFKCVGPSSWQVSLRSVPGTDVAAAAVRLGGGGHTRAAGFSFHGTLDEARQALVGALSR